MIVRRIDKNWHTAVSFIALAFHNSNIDGRHGIANSDDPSTSDSNLVSYGVLNGAKLCNLVYFISLRYVTKWA